MPGIDLDLLASEYPNVAVARRQVDVIVQVSKILRTMRKASNLSQADIAAALEVKQPRIAQIESGRPADAPSLNQIVAFALRCGFEINIEARPATSSGMAAAAVSATSWPAAHADARPAAPSRSAAATRMASAHRAAGQEE
jgi:transcriptional regulator with XRE-family HTH domain